MSLRQQCHNLVQKYGSATKLVVTSVLNVVAPGSSTLIEIAGQAFDIVTNAADKSAREEWERNLLASAQNHEAELERLGLLFEKLAGPLASLCDKANAFADQPDVLSEIIGRALATNPNFSQVLHDLGGIKEEFSFFQSDIQRLADRQEEAVPVYARMNRIADYFDELWEAGIKPKDFAHCLGRRQEAARHIEQGKTTDVDGLFLELRTATPQAASLCVLEAAAAIRGYDYLAAQRSLTSAKRLRPGDFELEELTRRVTALSSSATPNMPAIVGLESTGENRLQLGDSLDNWQLETRLGAGGWGQVFRATREGQTRALKVMHSNFATDRNFVNRFKKEISTLHRLPRHANLVQIEDFGYCAEWQTWYLTMEHIDGPTLERYLAKNGPLSEKQIRGVFSEVISGLAQAHAAGIIHRDIKPGNLIFRRSDKRLVLVDFGLAVGVEDFGQTKVGGLTVHFAAPEQHYGDSANQASDVFSLCAVMYYAMNYDKPDVRKPNRMNAKIIPESLRNVLIRGMVTNPEDRLQNAQQLLACFSPNWTDIEADYQSFLNHRKGGSGPKEWLKRQQTRIPRWQEGAGCHRPEAMVLLGRCYDEGIGVPLDYHQAMKWQRKAADVGNEVAMTNIGLLYVKGQGVPRDSSQAIKWYQKAADLGDAGAMRNIGALYMCGDGVPENFNKAMKWYQKAADVGDAGAMRYIGDMHQHGWGMAEDHDKAMKWYQKAADVGDSESMRIIGELSHPTDFTEAMKWFRKSADAGNAAAMRNIGKLYYAGEGVSQDHHEAMKWFNKAANAGDSETMRNFGLMCCNGQGVPQDFSKGMKWFRKAADAGNAAAMMNIGELYYGVEGCEGVSQDHHEAMKWFKQAANARNPDAMMAIAMMYINGSGVKEDRREGLNWYHKAADAGHSEAMWHIGGAYHHGLGVPKNYVEAMGWYQKAADAGNSKGMQKIGELYFAGRGVPEDFSEAMKWFRKAADAGEADAMRIIGLMYQCGDGVSKDYRLAVEWYHKAAEAGDEEAKELLRLMVS